MNRQMRVKILDSTFIPEERNFISNEEAQMVLDLLGIDSNTTKGDLRFIRNSVLEYYHTMKCYIREVEKDTPELTEAYKVIEDKCSAIIGTIDYFSYRKGWMF